MVITHKIPYSTSIENSSYIHDYIRQYSSCVHVLYNFIKDNQLSTKCSEHIVRGSVVLNKLSTLNNIDLIVNHYWLRSSVISNVCAIIEAEEERKKNDLSIKNSYTEDIVCLKSKLAKTSKIRSRRKIIRKIDRLKHKIQIIENKKDNCIFGGGKSFHDRNRGLISHDEIKTKRLSPLYSIGSKEHFNRLFEIKDDLNTIIFKPTKDNHIELCINGRSYKKQLQSLFIAQKNKELPCTFKIDDKYIYISYDNSKLYQRKHIANDFIKDRVMSIDLNPNYIGWSIVDWKGENSFSIIKSGVYSIKELNDEYFDLKNKHYSSESKERKHISNKRKTFIFEVSKNLINKAIHYKCEMFGYERLVINQDDKNKGKMFNSLCNNMWCRVDLVNNIKKRCDAYGIQCKEQLPDYSSFVGNFLFRSLNLPDMCLAAFEIGRRTYQSRYNFSLPREQRKKNIVFPDVKMFDSFLSKSLEEFGMEDVSSINIKKLYDSFKKSKTMYRLSLDIFRPKFSRLFPNSKGLTTCQFTPLVSNNNITNKLE